MNENLNERDKIAESEIRTFNDRPHREKTRVYFKNLRVFHLIFSSEVAFYEYYIEVMRLSLKTWHHLREREQILSRERFRNTSMIKFVLLLEELDRVWSKKNQKPKEVFPSKVLLSFFFHLHCLIFRENFNLNFSIFEKTIWFSFSSKRSQNSIFRVTIRTKEV